MCCEQFSIQTVNHIVDRCSLTKFEGGLDLLHEADDAAVIWLESSVTAALARAGFSWWEAWGQFSCGSLDGRL